MLKSKRAKENQNNLDMQTAKAFDITIKMPTPAYNELFLEKINTGAPSPEVLQKFTLTTEDNLIFLHLNNISDRSFCSGFLYGTSKLIKAMVGPKHEEEELWLHFEGPEAPGIAACIASSGLWQAKFHFNSQDLVDQFEALKQVIYKQVIAKLGEEG